MHETVGATYVVHIGWRAGVIVGTVRSSAEHCSSWTFLPPSSKLTSQRNIMRLLALTRPLCRASPSIASPLRTATLAAPAMRAFTSLSPASVIPRSTLSQQLHASTLSSTNSLFNQRRFLQNASSVSAAATVPDAAKSTANATFSYSNPPPKPKRNRGGFFSLLGKVFAALIILPALISIVFPSLLAFLIPAATILTVGATLLFTAALFFGFVLPLVLVTIVSVAVPAAIVYSELNKMVQRKQFDSVAWEILVPKRDFHIESSSSGGLIVKSESKRGKKRAEEMEVHADTGNAEFDLKVEKFARSAESFFVDLGAIVETEIMRRDLMGHVDMAGSYPRVVAIRGKDVGFLGGLMKRVEIPIDRDWVQTKVAERLAAAAK
ncbi:hypothetical protein BC830DRAFT_444884 [Chytriomyces sp. MP71]|nr:hypothetical protein BC830DRAFT_444884 [Chytriomyces sp. MP71]